MSIGTNTGISYPWAQGNFNISLNSTEILRKSLLGRNLDGSYLNRGNPIPPNGAMMPGSMSYTYLSDFSIIDSPIPEAVTNAEGIPLKTVQFLNNKYGPDTGYGNPLGINVVKLVDAAQLEYVNQNTLTPQGFVSSDYTAIEVLLDVNGSFDGTLVTFNGKILDDSILIKTSFPYLRDNLGFKQAQFLKDISDNGSAEYNITTLPEQLIGEKEDFMSRIDGQYTPQTTIPGFYFTPLYIPDINGIQNNEILQSSSLETATQLLNGVFNTLANSNPLPNTLLSIPVPSDTLLSYMGPEQQSQVFTALNYNIFRPDYSRTIQQKNTDVEAPLANYYIGSKDNNISNLQSPLEATPRDRFGRQIKAIVYGPSEMYKEFENVEGRALWRWYRIGDLGLATIDGGGLEGGFTWVGSAYIEDNQAPTSFLLNRSRDLPLKKGALLAQTQRLIESAPKFGASRYKHAGHAINQTSKMFNDGYKTISKGSAVVEPGESILGGAIATEKYCRVWTKDKPYFKYDDLQKSKGNQYGNTDSVLDSTYNLNIAPNKGTSTSLGPTHAKKYMFSLENLAWRGTALQSNLPKAERGPNGGRIMWFPPYDIQVGDTNSANWNPTNFLGRPEPIYTYSDTQRVGTLSFKLVVDHPSILNEIAQNQLKNTPSKSADKILEAFFAGCRKYDISELAEQYSSMSLDTLTQAQILANGGSSEVTQEFYSNPNLTVTDNNVGVNLFAENGTTPEEAQSAEDQQNSDVENAQESINNTTQGFPNGQSHYIGGEINFDSNNGSKFLQSLLNEEDYFTFLQEENPFIYQSIKDKLKYFHPSFHSTTPEGLNSRLTFLQQCLRPGQTIPTVTEQGTTIVDADNTAFGPPPVCVLRIGDFYHSKIIFDSCSFSYDPLVLDINPEGIGVQPMIVTVQTNFKFIGGQGLEGPVSELQNALSFSYFANTEIYDERSNPIPRQVNGGATNGGATEGPGDIANNEENLFAQNEGGTQSPDGETNTGGVSDSNLNYEENLFAQNQNNG